MFNFDFIDLYLCFVNILCFVFLVLQSKALDPDVMVTKVPIVMWNICVEILVLMLPP